jgi:hypothetical protein
LNKLDDFENENSILQNKVKDLEEKNNLLLNINSDMEIKIRNFQTTLDLN